NVIVVTNASSSDPILNIDNEYAADANQGAWICNGLPGGARLCDQPSDITDATSWSVPGSTTTGDDVGDCEAVEEFLVDHCLVQRTVEGCQVGVAVDLLIAVLVCNFVKAVCIFWTLWRASS